MPISLRTLGIEPVKIDDFMLYTVKFCVDRTELLNRCTKLDDVYQKQLPHRIEKTK